jgi:hypothetical protein
MAMVDLLLHRVRTPSRRLSLSTTRARTGAHHPSLSCPLPSRSMASVRKPSWQAFAPHGFIHCPRCRRPPGCVVSESFQTEPEPLHLKGSSQLLPTVRANANPPPRRLHRVERAWGSLQGNLSFGGYVENMSFRRNTQQGTMKQQQHHHQQQRQRSNLK